MEQNKGKKERNIQGVDAPSNLNSSQNPSVHWESFREDWLFKVWEMLNKTYEIGVMDIVNNKDDSMANLAADKIKEIIELIEINKKENGTKEK